MLFGSKKLLGVDIGSTSIKIAEVETSRGKSKLVNFAIISTPYGSVDQSGDITDSGAVGVAISNAIQSNKFKNKNAAVGLWGTGVAVRKIVMPRLDKKTLRDQIPFEAPQYLPYEIDNVSLSYQALDLPSMDGNMEVLLIGSPNTVITKYVESVEYAKLKCSVVDVACFALANLFEANYGKMLGEVVGVFNFGASVINFAVIKDGETIFCRDIPTGGQTYTNEIHKSMGISLDEAEALKLSAADGREVPPDVHSIIKNVNEQVADDVRNSFEYLLSSVNVAPSQCYFTGGSSTLPGMIETVSLATSARFVPLDPFNQIAVDPKRFPHSVMNEIRQFASIAIGLGLRVSGDSRD